MNETSNSAISISITRDERIASSPTSKGNQIKWRTNDGFWLKADDFGYEGLAEAVASRMLALSNISSFATYDTCTIEEEGTEYRGCVSKDFLAPGEQLITIHRLYETHGRDINGEFQRKSGKDRLCSLVETVTSWTDLPDFGPWLGKLLEFDAFILNEDRHTANIAVILKPDMTFGLMPVFDNGAAFMSDSSRDYPLHLSIFRLLNKVRSRPIVTHFDKQLEAVNDAIGLSLKFNRNFTKDICNCKLQTQEELNRVATIIEIQQRRYSHLFE